MTNNVCYDGVDAYVIKIIAPIKDYIVTNEGQKAIQEYINNSGMELLKTETLYGLEYENILAIMNSTEEKDKVIAERFKDMFF